jgi:hypothetical protein
LTSKGITENPGYNIREPFEEFVDWRQCAAVMQREAEIVNAKL